MVEGVQQGPVLVGTFFTTMEGGPSPYTAHPAIKDGPAPAQHA